MIHPNNYLSREFTFKTKKDLLSDYLLNKIQSIRHYKTTTEFNLSMRLEHCLTAQTQNKTIKWMDSLQQKSRQDHKILTAFLIKVF